MRRQVIRNHKGDLQATSTPNQDNPLIDITAVKALLFIALDLWENVYYIKYQNKRVEYIKSFWSIVNWQQVEEYRLALANQK
jgi:superoxide dismutase, Fe-Mn family